MWCVNILTLFPEIYPGPLEYSVSGRALSEKLCTIKAKDIRDFALDKNSMVDLPPYGGGGGMILKPDILGKAIENFFLPNGFPIVYLSPRGDLFNQGMARSFVQSAKGINILCGRFEGIDERVLKEYKICEVSIGDYVLSSGDVALFVVVDCCLRLLPGYFRNEESLKEESFGEGLYENLLEYPHYTRPFMWKSREVPGVLVSGDHSRIHKWRLSQAEEKTKSKRPDLWSKYLRGVKNELS